MKADIRLARIREIIDLAEMRLRAKGDGIAGIREEVTKGEWQEIYLLANCGKAKKPKKAMELTQ